MTATIASGRTSASPSSTASATSSATSKTKRSARAVATLPSLDRRVVRLPADLPGNVTVLLTELTLRASRRLRRLRAASAFPARRPPQAGVDANGFVVCGSSRRSATDRCGSLLACCGVFGDDRDAELAELLVGHRRRRARHRVDPGLVLWERERVADERLVEERHRHPVDPGRDPAVRRRAHRERVEEKAELLPLLIGRDPEQVEDLRLQLRLVDPERAAREL